MQKEKDNKKILLKTKKYYQKYLILMLLEKKIKKNLMNGFPKSQIPNHQIKIKIILI